MTTFVGTIAIRAMKNNDYQATIFDGTNAGLTAALAYAATNGKVVCGPGNLDISTILVVQNGTTLELGPGTYRMSGASGFSLGMGAKLKGQGYNETSLQVQSTFTGQGVVFNTTQDGTQQACLMESFQINGQRSSGGNPVNGIYLKGVGQITYIRDVVIFSMAQRGITLEGVNTNAAAVTLVENCWVNDCSDHGITVTGPMGAVTIHRTSVETIPANKAGIYIDGSSSATNQGGIWLKDIHIEVLAANSIGILLEDSKDITVDNVLHFGSGGNGDLVKITGTPLTNSYNCTLRNLYVRFNATATTVNDVSNGVTLTNEVHYYSTGNHRLINDIRAGTATIDGTLSANGATNNFGTVGVAQTTTVGRGGGGAFGSDLAINSGNSGATKARLLLQRNAQTDLLFQGDGTLEYMQARHNFQFGTTAGAQTALLTSTGLLRIGSSGTPTSHLEVAGAIISNQCPTLPDNTTPTVADVNVCKCSPAGPTTITNFTNGQTGQIIYIIFTNANATLSDAGTLKLNGGFVSTADDTMSLVYDGTNWFELARSVN